MIPYCFYFDYWYGKGTYPSQRSAGLHYLFNLISVNWQMQRSAGSLYPERLVYGCRLGFHDHLCSLYQG